MAEIFKLSNLQSKKEPKTNKDFKVAVGVEQVVEISENPIEEREMEETKEHVVIFKDARKSSLVDRTIILRRLKRPVETRLIAEESKRVTFDIDEPAEEVQEAEEAEPVEEDQEVQEVQDVEEVQEAEEGDKEKDIVYDKATKVPKKKRPRKTAAADFDIGAPVDLAVSRIGTTSVNDRLPQ